MKKQTYNYTILVKNTPDRYLHQESTLLPNQFKKTKYALLLKSCFDDGTEATSTIIYSNDLEELISLNKKSVSWYDYVNGLAKNIQGYIREL